MSGFEHALAPRSSHNRNDRQNQQRHQREKQHAQRFFACGSVRRAAAGTGSASSPAPCAPSTCTRICHEPDPISQTLPEKDCGSSFDWINRSPTGGYFAPGPTMYGRHNSDFRNAGCSAQNFHVRDSGNHLRRAHRDDQVIRTGSALKVDVRTPDVCPRRRAQEGNDREKGGERGAMESALATDAS